MSVLLVTGAAGRVGRLVTPLLAEFGWRLRLLDRRPVEDVPDAIVADVHDADAMGAAMTGVDAVLHLAGIATEAPFADICAANITGTQAAFEAARVAGVRRIVYASSVHAVGFVPRAPLVGVDVAPRPDTYYGLSKVFGEALARLYVDRHGMEVACVRIGTCFPRPWMPRHLATWLSPGDAARLVHACLTAPGLRFAVVYGISANTRAWWDLEPARALGYQPRDDAEAYATEIIAEHGQPDPDDVNERFVGGFFTRLEPPA